MRGRVLFGVLIAAAVLPGCTQAAPGTSPRVQGGAVTSLTPEPASSAARTRAHYAALAPEGALEQKAAGLIGAAYDAYVKSSSTSSATVYRDGGTVKPDFIGYYIRVFSPRRPNGKYDTAAVMVAGGAVTSDSTWGSAGDMTLTILPRTFVTEAPTNADEPLTPETARQKDAVAKAKAWFAKTFPGQRLERVDLCGFSFAYGRPGDAHWLLLHLQPETRGYYTTAH